MRTSSYRRWRYAWLEHLWLRRLAIALFAVPGLLYVVLQAACAVIPETIDELRDGWRPDDSDR